MTAQSFNIIQGDNTAILADFDDQSVDCIITDPPYLTRYRDRSGRQVNNDNREYRIKPIFAELYRELKNDRFLISFYGWNHIDLFMYVWKRVGFRPVGHIVWLKNYASKNGFLQAKHEQAFLLAKGNPERPDEPIPDVLPWDYSGNRHHPTEKAVSTFTPLVETFTKTGDLILDPFCGAGGSGVASVQLNRRYIGIDLETDYCDVTRKRLSDAMGETS